ncbi:MAG: hypothetical protein VKL60_21675 [Sphaerospermopsis sp.]|jgi:hypothetical protein|nr:hypothetical protein [Sphaerospermopsis sp.]
MLNTAKTPIVSKSTDIDLMLSDAKSLPGITPTGRTTTPLILWLKAIRMILVKYSRYH